MKVFPIRNLLFISLLVFQYSCAFRNYGLTDVMESAATPATKIQPVFPDSFNTRLFKAKVDLYGKYFGGLIFLKKLQNDNFRMVMTTETGLQIFDLELNADSMVVHACFDKLNKPPVLKTIENDFRLILMQNTENQKYKQLVDQQNLFKVLKNQQGKTITYYFIENKTGYLTRIEQASPWYKKVTVELSDFVDEKANSIVFSHHNARLQIRLRVLKNER